MSVEQALYFDPQAEVPGGFCSRCGGSLYRPGLYCIRCERGKIHDSGGDE